MDEKAGAVGAYPGREDFSAAAAAARAFDKYSGRRAPRPKTKEQREALIQTNHFGGLWSYGRVKMETANVAEEGKRVSSAEQKELIDEAQANVSIPLLVGVDCENGAGYTFAAFGDYFLVESFMKRDSELEVW